MEDRGEDRRNDRRGDRSEHQGNARHNDRCNDRRADQQGRAQRAQEDQRRKQAGLVAEEQALAHLKAAGLRLLARNYRCKAGEIDLVMLDGSTLVLVEVRYRSNLDFGGAAESVTWRKQRRLVNAAHHLLLKRADLRRYPARFDVIAVSPSAHGAQLDWIRHAFTL